MKHQGAFAKDKNNLGTCFVVKHYIDACGSAPIHQPPRMVPRQFEAEEGKYLQEQLQTGVIVPSSSAWATPVVLVRKKSDNSVRTVKDAYPIPRIDMSQGLKQFHNKIQAL